MIIIKKLFWYFLIIFIIVVVISLLIIINKKISKPIKKESDIDKKLSLLNHIDKKIDFFNYSYLDRYINYRNKYSLLNDIDIITRVNIGLDRPFYQNTRQSRNLNQINILVNKYNYLPNDYVPNNLEKISSRFTSSTRELVYEARDSFEKMATAALEDGYTIRAISSYRSFDYQKGLYDNYVKKDGVLLADTYSARPGYSEHQTGLVVDIDNGNSDFNNFDETEEFLWMQENCFLYGFILRYPKGKEEITGYNYESWHYRYVGKSIASFIYKNDITYDEYYARYIDK